MIGVALAELHTEDCLLLTDLSSLGHSLLECLEILSFCLEKQLRIYTLQGNWLLDVQTQGPLAILIFTMVAQIERNLISQRARQAMQVKKAKGDALGRPKGTGKSRLDAFKQEIEQMLASGMSQQLIARYYQTTDSNLHHWLKKNHLRRVFQPFVGKVVPDSSPSLPFNTGSDRPEEPEKSQTKETFPSSQLPDSNFK